MSPRLGRFQASTNLWPVYIGLEKGFFTAENINVDLVFAQSNAAVNQQLAAGSINFAINTGLVDPIRAIEKGAAAAILRIEVQGPPYILDRPLEHQEHEGAQGQDRLARRRQGYHPHLSSSACWQPEGVKPGEFDMIFAGATSARFAALQSGAVDAAILAPPFSFRAEAAGFSNLGLTIDYVKDLPFAGTVVHRTWAAANRRSVEKVLTVYNKSIAWFHDGKNRAEAVRMMVAVSRMQPEDVEKAYDFLTRGSFSSPRARCRKPSWSRWQRRWSASATCRTRSMSSASLWRTAATRRHSERVRHRTPDPAGRDGVVRLNMTASTQGLATPAEATEFSFG